MGNSSVYRKGKEIKVKKVGSHFLMNQSIQASYSDLIVRHSKCQKKKKMAVAVVVKSE
jgi:hypothetical protein